MLDDRRGPRIPLPNTGSRISANSACGMSNWDGGGIYTIEGFGVTSDPSSPWNIVSGVGPELYYQLDDGTGFPALILLQKIGTGGIRIHF